MNEMWQALNTDVEHGSMVREAHGSLSWICYSFTVVDKVDSESPFKSALPSGSPTLKSHIHSHCSGTYVTYAHLFTIVLSIRCVLAICGPSIDINAECLSTTVQIRH